MIICWWWLRNNAGRVASQSALKSTVLDTSPSGACHRERGEVLKLFALPLTLLLTMMDLTPLL